MTLETPEIAPKVLYSAGSFDFTVTMLSSCVVTAVLVVFAVVVRVFLLPRWEKDVTHVSGLRVALEYAVSMFDTDSRELTDKYSKLVGPLYFGASAFIMFGVLIELFGLRSPLSDLNCDLVFGVTTFAVVFTVGFLHGRARRFKHYATVIPLITDCVVPFSMALRLFGSVFSGYLIMEIVYAFCPYVLPAALEPLFTLFHALIQSYVFMFLSMNFINEALE
ncbi:MAG: F0F1 ATP synthase subunit A [Roseburia sp.]|nr:F0F1 ATP synthase subunit A [Roseburia sp.]